VEGFNLKLVLKKEEVAEISENDQTNDARSCQSVTMEGACDEQHRPKLEGESPATGERGESGQKVITIPAYFKWKRVGKGRV